MKTIAIAARILLGAMFIFSGFVKGIDPWVQLISLLIILQHSI